ncbi:MAG: 2-C-methyl-D-erythritol 4-phosphate cytidylyltransferase [Succinivibrionaceae bacterium]|nr:2-C-methyl-D-erythritol 4-phosphate cytidylyltransferase [Succinivibrionaceae bacterium]
MSLPGGLRIDVVVPAAGQGRRMGSAVPKQYLRVGGHAILELTLGRLLGLPFVGRVVVALAAGDGRFGDLRCAADPRVVAVTGGAERADSVRAALGEVSTEWVLVHDAARPFVRPGDIEALVEACLGDGGVGGILAVPIHDTVKEGEGGRIARTRPRDGLFRAQTPQMFRAAALREALSGGVAVTDEASALEARGERPLLVMGSELNFKVTTSDDLRLAQALWDAGMLS